MTTMEQKKKERGEMKYLCCQVVNMSCWNLWLFQRNPLLIAIDSRLGVILQNFELFDYE
jgi:surface polysaccharide O-acyltransferase-like enzyme